MVDQKSPSKGAIIAFTTAAAATAAVVGILSYLLVMRRLRGNPDEILNRCQDAITRLEKQLAIAER
ncbi:MAG: hypothetical protein P4L33_14645 [Capsulimonadaceae bacterium]|nr:hypothetical protein [Capsulimonadaceae bacterium]